MRSSTAWIIFTICLAIFGVAFLWPLFIIVGKGFTNESGHFTLEYLVSVFRNPIYLEGLRNSLLIAIGTTTLVTCIAIPLAWLNNKYDYPGKKLLSAMLLVPMILPPFVGAIGMSQILGQYGVLNSLFHLGPIDWLGKAQYFGVILLQAFSLFPIMYLNVSAAQANIDPAMGEAAENLGITGFTKFRKITLPLIMPGIFAGGTIVFIWSFTELGTPLMLNYTRCTPVQVWDTLKDIAASRFPYALVFVMLTSSVLLYVVGRLIFGRNSYAMQSKASTANVAQEARGAARVLVPLLFATTVFLALLPHIGVIFTSISPAGSWYHSVFPTALTGDHFAEALGHEMTVGSIRNSLFYSSLAVFFNLIVGIAIAFVVVRSTIPVRSLLDTLAMMPLAVPGIVMAFGYLAISTMLANTQQVKDSPLLTHIFDVRVNPTMFLVIAYAIRRLPYMVRSAVAGLQQTSITLEEAGKNLGASGLYTLRRITIPLITANLLAGAMLAFAFSMLEVSDSLMLAQRADYFPITKTIFELFQLIGTGKFVASALGVWAMVFLAVTIIGASLILGKKMGAIFRV